MSGRKYGSDKEVAAVTFNMKEQRCLEKSLQTLTLEKTYSLKLLDLDHRIIKVNYRRLKDKVSRIKSNLSADEISDLRQLEADGKLRPAYNSVNISGALKIAAASRRLKFQRPLRDRASSAHPRLTGRNEGTTHPTPTLPGLCRSNSVTGVFIDAPASEVTRRRMSVDVIPNNDKLRPFSAFTIGQSSAHETKGDEVNKRPATSSCVGFDKTKLVSRPTTGASCNSVSHGHTHSPFSSHSQAEKDARVPSASINRRQSRELKSMYPSDDSIDSNLGDDLYEERRQELLEEELARTEELELRKEEFLQKIDDYLRRTSSLGEMDEVAITKAESLKSLIVSERVSSAKNGKRLTKRRQMKVDFDQTPTFLPEADYRRRLFNLWTDMNKCRYLRVPEELIDLSGIQTLAKDQMLLFEVLRKAEQDSLTASAEL
ncbi:uncharacterized protein LOC124259739 [Haliotis rubra]|uniref:uncharacterized protein LOC124259739 n=1 Tax=Haliotis rubra TaxID=36100 RepID=UPI001EE62C52|nr:uncharacterized protein LOC124259739 [Haliotis rubra]XP_046549886.1 uncharacterized protein LOC124259739 [Haliotis rubra]